MTVLQNITGQAPASVGVSETPKALFKIHKPGCAAAIWNRYPLATFQTWLDDLPPEALPRARLILPTDAVQDAIEQMCRLAGTPDTPECGMLVGDIAALADIFADVMGVGYLRVRLDVVQTNACHKFHIDALTARLICTYRGTGTQYGLSADGTDPETVYTVPTCAPIVLRGRDWPAHTHADLLHRSPPVEGTGETRLVLVLDPVLDPGRAAQAHPMTRH